jgi:hypothetical protein
MDEVHPDPHNRGDQVVGLVWWWWWSKLSAQYSLYSAAFFSLAWRIKCLISVHNCWIYYKFLHCTIIVIQWLGDNCWSLRRKRRNKIILLELDVFNKLRKGRNKHLILAATMLYNTFVSCLFIYSFLTLLQAFYVVERSAWIDLQTENDNFISLLYHVLLVFHILCICAFKVTFSFYTHTGNVIYSHLNSFKTNWSSIFYKCNYGLKNVLH